MNKIVTVGVVSILLTLGGCVTATPQMRTRYTLDSAGNLQQQQYQVMPTKDPNEAWKIAGIVTLGLIGLGTFAYLIDRNNNSSQTVVQQPQSPLVPTSGESSWSTKFIQPTYIPVN